MRVANRQLKKAKVVDDTVVFDDGAGTAVFERTEIIRHLNELCAYREISHTKLLPDLLRYLTWLQIRPRALPPDEDHGSVAFQEWVKKHQLPSVGSRADTSDWRESSVSGQTIVWQFYQWAEAIGLQINVKDTSTYLATADAGKHLIGDLRDALASYYAENAGAQIKIDIKTRYRPLISRRSVVTLRGEVYGQESNQSPVDKRLSNLFADPVHLYHLTLDKSGNQIWCHTVLHFLPEPGKNQMVAVAETWPQKDLSPSERTKHKYDFKARYDRNQLIVETRRTDDTDDMSVQLFSGAQFPNFPLCGSCVIAHTWYGNPVSSISILHNRRLECCHGMLDGEPISDPATIRELMATWHQEANKINLALLPHDVTIHNTWDSFFQLLSTIKRDESESEDLRILTMAFTSGTAPEDKLVQLAKDGLRIKILLTDPKLGAPLVDARHVLRRINKEESEESAFRSLKTQISKLEEKRAYLRRLQGKGIKGDLDFRLSGLFPYGFSAQSSTFVIIGLFLATSSYGTGPMIVVDTTSNPQFSETLKKEWHDRWDYEESVRVGSAHQIHRNIQPAIITDSAVIDSLEPNVAEGTEIWVASPDLSNVGDRTSPYSERVREVVTANAKRGINYNYIVPKGQAGTERIKRLRDCFHGTKGRLNLAQVPTERFQELTLVHSHFICFDPDVELPHVFMQLPLSTAEKGWAALDPNDSERVLRKMKALFQQSRSNY